MTFHDDFLFQFEKDINHLKKVSAKHSQNYHLALFLDSSKGSFEKGCFRHEHIHRVQEYLFCSCRGERDFESQ